MSKLLTPILCSVLSIGMLDLSGLADWSKTAQAGELTDETKWAAATLESLTPIDDLRVTYAIKMETDVQDIDSIDKSCIEGLIQAGTIETFDLSFLEEDEEKDVSEEENNSQTNYYTDNSSTNTTNNVSNTTNTQNNTSTVSNTTNNTTSTTTTTTTTTTKPVTQVVTGSQGLGGAAPAGQWCVYQGTTVAAFNASLFPAGTAAEAEKIYNNVVQGIQGSGVFASKDEAWNVANVFSKTYGVQLMMTSTNNTGKCTAYFSGMPEARRNAGTYAEQIVQQLFPNGGYARDVVNGIARWICNHTTYQMGSPSAETLFTSGIGNCNAYASAFKQMCNAMGIECNIIAGWSIDGGVKMGHAWNQVLIGGAWYYVDVCFADTGADWGYILSAQLWPDHTDGVLNNDYINSY